ncbi:membrane protein [Candidatus Magnetobacterium bavaricum]|uniref:Membrane protein n=1 Tax=Candidatus Magnetobacterium bavaricum TaxID=29290 RepID=A0A0F3GND7_9BACT|nr:membrane protein [Candidatus Magnetobacterium bavaricum]
MIEMTTLLVKSTSVVCSARALMVCGLIATMITSQAFMSAKLSSVVLMSYSCVSCCLLSCLGSETRMSLIPLVSIPLSMASAMLPPPINPIIVAPSFLLFSIY